MVCWQVHAPEASSNVRRLGGALTRLTTKERHVVLLIAWGELSYEKVAAALDIPIGTVRSRLNRARRRLRDSLDRAAQPEDLS